MGFWHEYALFLSKLITFAVVIVAIIIVFVIILAIANKAKQKSKGGKLTIRSLNEHYQDIADAMHEMVQTKNEKKLYKKKHKTELKQQEKMQTLSEPLPRLFVINFQGDIRASAVTALREEITAVLLAANKTDQVLLRLESPGGMVHAYGLASSQLQRLKDAGIKFIVAVDKVAASGGYMMACIADQIIAAPFAIVGSIGVIAQLPNFHRLLDKKHIDFEQIMAGKYKRTLTMFGENTDEGRRKMQHEIDDTQELFKEFIAQHRPQVNLELVATGEHWFATRAQGLRLVDKLQTSDDFLLSAKDYFALYEVEYQLKKALGQKLSSLIFSITDKFFHASAPQ